MPCRQMPLLAYFRSKRSSDPLFAQGFPLGGSLRTHFLMGLGTGICIL